SNEGSHEKRSSSPAPARHHHTSQLHRMPHHIADISLLLISVSPSKRNCRDFDGTVKRILAVIHARRIGGFDHFGEGMDVPFGAVQNTHDAQITHFDIA